jgi:hypothetical protein
MMFDGLRSEPFQSVRFGLPPAAGQRCGMGVLDLHRGQLRQWHRAEGRDEVRPDNLAIAFEGLGADPLGDMVSEPGLQVGADRQPGRCRRMVPALHLAEELSQPALRLTFAAAHGDEANAPLAGHRVRPNVIL